MYLPVGFHPTHPDRCPTHGSALPNQSSLPEVSPRNNRTTALGKLPLFTLPLTQSPSRNTLPLTQNTYFSQNSLKLCTVVATVRNYYFSMCKRSFVALNNCKGEMGINIWNFWQIKKLNDVQHHQYVLCSPVQPYTWSVPMNKGATAKWETPLLGSLLCRPPVGSSFLLLKWYFQALLKRQRWRNIHLEACYIKHHQTHCSTL